MKDGKGYIGSLTSVTKNSKLTPAFRTKFIEVIGAQISKSKPEKDDNDDNKDNTTDDTEDNGEGEDTQDE